MLPKQFQMAGIPAKDLRFHRSEALFILTGPLYKGLIL
jgi:hypothetical protein